MPIKNKNTSTGAVLTGSTGNAVQDSAIRGSYIGALNAAAALALMAFSASDAVTVAVMAIVGFLSLATWGLFDRVYRRYLA